MTTLDTWLIVTAGTLAIPAILLLIHSEALLAAMQERRLAADGDLHETMPADGPPPAAGEPICHVLVDRTRLNLVRCGRHAAAAVARMLHAGRDRPSIAAWTTPPADPYWDGPTRFRVVILAADADRMAALQAWCAANGRLAVEHAPWTNDDGSTTRRPTAVAFEPMSTADATILFAGLHPIGSPQTGPHGAL